LPQNKDYDGFGMIFKNVRNNLAALSEKVNDSVGEHWHWLEIGRRLAWILPTSA